MSLLPLVRRTVRAQRAALLALGLLVLITAFLADAAPRTLVRGYDRAARETISSAPMGAPDIVVTSMLPAVEATEASVRAHIPTSNAAGFAATGETWRRDLPERLRSTIVSTDRLAASDFLGIAGPHNRQLSFAYSGTAGSHVRYTSGHAPGAPKRQGGVLRLETGLPASAARTLDIKAGDDVHFAGQPGIIAHVSGLFSPIDAKDPYWPSHQKFLVAETEEFRDGTVVYYGSALLDPEGYQALCARTLLKVTMTWTYTPGPDKITARDAHGLSDDVHRTAETVATARIGFTPATVSTRFDRLLDDFTARLRTAQTLLSLTLAGLFATGLGVLALTAQLLLSRLRTALTTQAARGASPVQLGALTAAVAGLVTLPTAVLGLALSALTVPGPAQNVSYVAALVLVAVTIGLPAVAAARTRRGTGGSSSRRLVAECLVVVLAVSGAYLLRRRGLTTNSASGVDPLLSAVPALLAVAAGLVTLRLYPYPLRLACRALARGRSAVAFVGFARASRRHATAVLPLLVLLLAVAVIGFGTTVRTSLSNTQRLATWETVGGDARVDAQILDPAMVERVRHSPGVRAITAVRVLDTARLTTADGEVSDELPVVGVDLDTYRRMMADTPLKLPALPKAAGSAVPALFSPGAAATTRPGGLTLSTDYGLRVPLLKAGTIDRFPGQEAGGRFIVMPYSAMARATVGQVPGVIFVRGDHIDLPALSRNASAPQLGALGINPVTTYRASFDSITGGELGHLVGAAFGTSTLLVACYGTLAILVLLFSGAQARGRSVSYLRTLGLSRRQAHGLVFVEVVPPLFAASIAGWALGAGLPSIVGPALNLRTYTGGFPVARHVLDIASTAALTGGLLAFAVLAVLIDAVVGARQRLGSVLRIGDT